MRCTSLLMLVTLFVLALAGCAPKLSPSIPVLESIERKLSGAEAQSHKIDLPGDKYFRINVAQIGIDAIVEVRDANDDTIVTVNTPSAREGKESILLRTIHAGTYKISVRSNDHAAKQGSYRLTVQELSNQTRDDARRIKAQQAMTAAAELNFRIAGSSNANSIEKMRANAIEKYELAVAAWDKLEDEKEQGWALYYMASHQYDLFKWKTAADIAADAAVLFRIAEEPLIFASALQFQGMALIETYEKSDFDTALEKFSQALVIQKKGADVYAQANTINYSGLGYFQQSEFSKAREQFVKASELFRSLGESDQEFLMLNNIAAADQMAGNYPQALATYKRALSLEQGKKSSPNRANLLDNLATVNAVLGDLQSALLNYQEAADAFAFLGDRLGNASALNGIGFTYGRLGNWERALKFYQQALKLQQGPSENRALVKTQLNIGNAYRMLNRPKQAIEAHENAQQLAKVASDKSQAHLELGRDYVAKKNNSAAIEQFNQALEIATGDEAARVRASALRERGTLKVKQNIDISVGLSDLRLALQAHRQLHSSEGEAKSLQAMARAEHKLGHVAKAIEHAAQALEIIETLRVRVGSPKLRMSFTGMQRPSYELHIALLMELANSEDKNSALAQNYSALALEASERARARSFIELLAEAHTDDSQGIDAELIRARNDKRQQLAGFAFRLESIANSSSKDSAVLRKALQKIQTELDVIEAKIRNQNSQYSQLTQPQLLRATQIQALLAADEEDEEGTILLEYSLGEESSYVWCVSENSIQSWSLPGRASIEAAALNTYNRLNKLDLDRASMRSAQRASAELARIILEPAKRCLTGQRLVIVPDDSLQYIPFAALPISTADSSSAPLLTKYEVVILPSASTLAVLRDTHRQRKPAPKTLAIFADPVFTEHDSRFAQHSKIERHAAMRSSEERGRNLLRLPASGREADAIANLAAPQPVLMATGFDASRATVLNAELADYRYIHFATHGLINTQYPGLSSLALSAIDKNGATQPGFLRLHDIYSLKLNAELVVLSACEAALGKDIRGEGLIGLTRGFMYAGATSVVASLWRASDEATAALMQEFYRQILQQGLKPAAALREAQLLISRQRKWHAPYYWAGFILQGDWR